MMAFAKKSRLITRDFDSALTHIVPLVGWELVVLVCSHLPLSDCV